MQIFPDWMKSRTTPEIRVYFLLVLVSLALIYYTAFNLRKERIKLEKRINSFQKQVQVYKTLKARELSQDAKSDQLKLQDESPLSYLERIVPQDKLTKLSPNDQGNETFTIDLRLEDVTPKIILDLLYTIEKDGVLEVVDFTLIRSTLTGKKFQLVMELEN